MPNCTDRVVEFPRLGRRRIEAEFSGGDISSDGGVMLLRQVDRHLRLLASVAEELDDPRSQRRCAYDQLSMLRQRVYGLCLGYEDLNDQRILRTDPALQSAVDRNEPLASEATLRRFENRMARKAAWSVHRVLLDQFIGSFDTPPKELILDFDATDDTVHGRQQGRFFLGYYASYWFLPLYVFCGDQLLVAYLRTSDRDAAKHTGAILKLLVREQRQAWPEVKITFRADSGFCRHRRVGLQGTEMARARVDTIRLQLLKVGAIVIRNSWRIRLLLSSAYPHPDLYVRVAETFAPP